jgi:DNA-binding MarR family transcriptional regulator
MRDFCRLHQDDTLGVLAQCKLLPLDAQANEIATQDTRRRLLSSEEVLNLPPASWLIDLVLPANDLTIIYGLPGTGKSMIALDIACVLAQVMPVVYVAAEALPTNTSRLAAWQAHHGLRTDNLHWWDGPVNLLNPADVILFLAAIEPLQPGAIFFDTLAMCMPGSDENGNADMSQAVDQLRKIRERTGAAVVPLHHSDKAGLTPRGHSSLIGACASIIKVTNDDGMIAFRSEKQRNGNPFDTRLFHLVEKPEVDGVVLLPTSKIDQRNSPLSERALLVLEELCEPLNDDGLNQKEIAEALGLHPQQVKRVVEKLAYQGFIRKTKNDKRKVFVPTVEGRQLSKRHEAEAHQTATQEAQGTTLNWLAVIPHQDERSHRDHTPITSDRTSPRDQRDQGTKYTPIEGFYPPSECVITPITPEPSETEGDVIAQERPDHTRSHRITPDHTLITGMCDQPITESHPCGPFRGHGECDQEDVPVIVSSADLPPGTGAGADAPPDAAQAAVPATDGAAPDLPDGWQLVRCDHKGNVTRFGSYWRAAHTSGEMTEPTQYPDTAARHAQARGEQQREVRHE